MSSSSRIEIGSLALTCSNNFKKSIIFWDMDRYDSWLIIGWQGLTFCYSKDNTDDPHIKHPQHIYNIIGVDIL